MKTIRKTLQKWPKLYSLAREAYGESIGLWSLKRYYVKKIGLFNGEKRIKLLGKKQAEEIIYKELLSDKPFMLARYGSNEFRNLFQDNELETLCFNAGFFPNDKKLLTLFRKEYLESSKQIDCLCIWNYLNHFSNKVKLIKNFPNIKYLVSFEAVGGTDHKWIKALEGKKILVIHPFKKTIEAQYKKRTKLKILPRFKKLEVTPAVQTIAGNHDPRFKSWFDALEWMKKEIDKKDFDIALLGCGAYGLPLAAYIKSKGKKSIHLGGSLQLLFGIIGSRWEDSKSIKPNKYWTRPLPDDIPKEFKKIEGGCYW